MASSSKKRNSGAFSDEDGAAAKGVSKNDSGTTVSAERDSYTDLLDLASEMIVSVDEFGNIREASAIVSTVTGYSNSELRRMNIFEHILFEEDIPAMRRVVENLTKGIPQIFRTRWVSKEGAIVYIKGASTAKFTKDNEFIQTRCILKDETVEVLAKKLAEDTEEKYKNLFEWASDAIFIEDLEMQKFVQVNKRACLLSGYTKKELFKRGGVDLTPEKYRTLADGAIEEIIDKGSATWDHFLETKKGTVVPVEISATLINYDGRQVLYGLIRDRSERVEAEEKLRDAFEQVDRLHQELKQENIYLKKEISLNSEFKEIVYQSDKIGDLLADVEKVAKTNSTVMILGETGTGKELIAQSVHNLSDRKNARMITVNCSVLPGELIESELFGHKKGAFTGAVADKLGRFQLADKGTIFLDEIGDLPFYLQAKLLRVLQEGEIDPIGAERSVKVDVRIIVATNKDLQRAMDNHEFRPDLYYRLFVFPLILPPLRERKEDIPLLVGHFVNEFNKVLGKSISEVNSRSMERLINYSWPGNIRELENVIERAVILTSGETLIIDSSLDSKIEEVESTDLSSNLNSLKEMEKAHILSVLQGANWRINGPRGAALVLGLPPSTLRDKMRRLGIEKGA